MGIVGIDDLQPGMMLASDLRTKQGRLLLPSGAYLSAKHLKIARIWGISEADVHSATPVKPFGKPLQDVDPELKADLDALTAWKFALCDHDLAITRMLVALFHHRVAQDLTRTGCPEVLNKHRYSPSIPTFVSTFSEKDDRPDLEHIVAREVELVTLPDVFHELLEVVESPTSSAAHIAEVVSKDTSLSTRLLRLVNSSFFGFMSRVDTLSRAVTIIGTGEIANLALGIAITSTFDDIPNDIIAVHDFWEHSLAVGIIARTLAAQVKESKLERIFVGGVLHDIGRLVLIKNYPQMTANMILHSASQPISLQQIEQDQLGFSHADLGGALLKAWNIPQSLQDMVCLHHTPARDVPSKAALLMHIADSIAHAVGHGHSGFRRVHPITASTWAETGLSLNALPVVVAQAQNQLRDLMRIIVQEKCDAA